MPFSRLLVAGSALALALTGLAGADGGQLHGSVGSDFSISLKDASGAAVKHLDPGTYALVVDDTTDAHNFHLQGPGGVDVATKVDGVGQSTFSVPLVDGKYVFLCDQHPTTMRGTFAVGAVPEPPPAQPPSTRIATRLVLTLTRTKLSLTNPAGVIVKTVKAGPAVVTVRDRSAVRGARLTGSGANRTSGVRFVGGATWKVTLAAGPLVYSSVGLKPALRGGRAKVS